MRVQRYGAKMSAIANSKTSTDVRAIEEKPLRDLEHVWKNISLQQLPEFGRVEGSTEVLQTVEAKPATARHGQNPSCCAFQKICSPLGPKE